MKKLESLIKESRLPIQLEESDLSLPVGGFFIDFRKHAEAGTNQKPDEIDSVNYQLSTSPPIVTAMLNHQIMFSYKFEGSTSEMAWKLFGDVEKMFIQGTEATQSSMLASAVSIEPASLIHSGCSRRSRRIQASTKRFLIIKL